MKFNEQLYRKILSGDSLTDTEVEVGATHFAALFEMLHATGPEWRLAADAAWKHKLRLDDMRRARQNGNRFRPAIHDEFVLKPDADNKKLFSADAPFSGGAVVTRERHEAVLAESLFEARTSIRHSSAAVQSLGILTALRDTVAKRQSEDLPASARSDIIENVLNPAIALATTIARPSAALASQ